MRGVIGLGALKMAAPTAAGTGRIRSVIDRTERSRPGSLSIVWTTHALFSGAVERAVPRMRFKPAEVRGMRVRQSVEMPSVFSLRR